jgi:hypothetical protein
MNIPQKEALADDSDVLKHHVLALQNTLAEKQNSLVWMKDRIRLLEE